MLKVLFFARIREELDCASLDVEFSNETTDPQSLVQFLSEHKGDQWAQVLGQDNLICAINQTVVEEACSLVDGDEVAFFPPVTGG